MCDLTNRQRGELNLLFKDSHKTFDDGVVVVVLVVVVVVVVFGTSVLQSFRLEIRSFAQS